MLSENAFYHSDLEGFQVYVSETEKHIGVFGGIETSPAHDIWLVKTPKGDLQVPSVRHFIQKVDPDRKQIVLQNLRELP